VLDDEGRGEASKVIMAMAAIQRLNIGGLRVHGVNIGLDYETDSRRFAVGRSPICVEAERLVRSGVVVVAPAGNTGYGKLNATARMTNQGMEVSIQDPGNAELVITVGSTDREMPHLYGVSYFFIQRPYARRSPQTGSRGAGRADCVVHDRRFGDGSP
jgi:serine protease AprX